ncbi:hypothetical protein, partial [Burkholderia thailandensis]
MGNVRLTILCSYIELLSSEFEASGGGDVESARGIRPTGDDMTEAFLCDAIRTPIGRYGGALAPV